MAKVQTVVKKRDAKKVSRPNVHAKTKCSACMSSKNYKKKYKGQGR